MHCAQKRTPSHGRELQITFHPYRRPFNRFCALKALFLALTEILIILSILGRIESLRSFESREQPYWDLFSSYYFSFEITSKISSPVNSINTSSL